MKINLRKKNLIILKNFKEFNHAVLSSADKVNTVEDLNIMVEDLSSGKLKERETEELCKAFYDKGELVDLYENLYKWLRKNEKDF